MAMSKENRHTVSDEILSFEDQANFLDSLSLNDDEFRRWFETALKGNAFPIYLGEAYIYERIIEIYSFAKPRFQQAIRLALAYLIRSWNGGNDDLRYLDDLLFLVGKLRVIDAYEHILIWVHQNRFKHMYIDQQHERERDDIHISCLRSIGPQGLTDQRLIKVCLRDIKYPEYFGICYRILYEHDLKFLKKFFPAFIRFCINNYYSFKNQFFYINKLYGDDFWDSLIEFLSSLPSEEQRNFLIQSLREIDRVKYDKFWEDLAARDIIDISSTTLPKRGSQQLAKLIQYS